MNDTSKRELTEREKAQAMRAEIGTLRADVEAQWPEVIETTTKLREMRERNHFADMIFLAIGGGKI